MKPDDKAIEAGFNACTTVSRSIVIDILTAAFAAQFPPSEDYAGLVKELRKVEPDLPGDRTRWYRNPNGPDAADALEALLAERDALKAELASGHMWIQMRATVLEELAMVRAERDALRARLVPVGDEVLEAKAAAAIIAVEHNGIDDEFILEARAAIAAIRPHIEAAERERCARLVEPSGPRPCESCVFESCWCGETLKEKEARDWDDYTDLAAAIRSGK